MSNNKHTPVRARAKANATQCSESNTLIHSRRQLNRIEMCHRKNKKQNGKKGNVLERTNKWMPHEWLQLRSGSLIFIFESFSFYFLVSCFHCVFQFGFIFRRLILLLLLLIFLLLSFLSFFHRFILFFPSFAILSLFFSYFLLSK